MTGGVALGGGRQSHRWWWFDEGSGTGRTHARTHAPAQCVVRNEELRLGTRLEHRRVQLRVLAPALCAHCRAEFLEQALVHEPQAAALLATVLAREVALVDHVHTAAAKGGTAACGAGACFA